jgi:two-component system cell cycle sensor histidine kinase/response regulator CckA
LADVVIETEDLLRAGIGVMTRIVLDVGGCNALVEADRNQLGQVLFNLCLNANDAMGGRGGTITMAVRDTPLEGAPLDRLAKRANANPTSSVETWTDASGEAWAVSGSFDPTQPYVTLEVSDTGIGMDAGLLLCAFTPYFTTKPKGRGTGLGLPVVQSIVLSHEGALIVRTRPGKGTCVDIVLPRLPDVELRFSEADSPTVEAPDRKRLLVVDDDPDFGDMLTLALERRGFFVTACADPVEALGRFRDQPHSWDAVISDQSMPDLCGLELLQEIGALRPDIPRILCYGYSEKLLDETNAATQAHAVFRKPLDIAALLTTLTKLLAPRRSTRRARKKASLGV